MVEAGARACAAALACSSALGSSMRTTSAASCSCVSCSDDLIHEVENEGVSGK